MANLILRFLSPLELITMIGPLLFAETDGRLFAGTNGLDSPRHLANNGLRAAAQTAPGLVSCNPSQRTRRESGIFVSGCYCFA